MFDFFRNPVTPAYADKKFEANKAGFLRDYERATAAGVTPSKEHKALYYAIIRKATHTEGIAIDGMRVLVARDTLADRAYEQGKQF